jgi:hypothetical protein
MKFFVAIAMISIVAIGCASKADVGDAEVKLPKGKAKMPGSPASQSGAPGVGSGARPTASLTSPENPK